jgi:hypothetical protein
MSFTLTVTQAYATVAEADVYLENDATWNALSDESKTDALLDARYWIDSTFSCDFTTDTTIPDEMKYANSKLAAEYAADETIFDNPVSVKRERVKADTVESEKEYSGGKSNTPKALTIVKAIVSDYCTHQGSTVSLLRT